MAHAGAHRGSRQPHEAPRSLQRRPDTPGSDLEAIFERLLGPRTSKTSKSAVLSAYFVVLAISQGSVHQRPNKPPKDLPGRPK